MHGIYSTISLENIYLFKINYRLHIDVIDVVNSEQIPQLFLMLLLLTLNR